MISIRVGVSGTVYTGSPSPVVKDHQSLEVSLLGHLMCRVGRRSSRSGTVTVSEKEPCVKLGQNAEPPC